MNFYLTVNISKGITYVLIKTLIVKTDVLVVSGKTILFTLNFNI